MTRKPFEDLCAASRHSFSQQVDFDMQHFFAHGDQLGKVQGSCTYWTACNCYVSTISVEGGCPYLSAAAAHGRNVSIGPAAVLID